MSEELKPCPFCGGNVELVDASPDDPEWGTPYPWWLVVCERCHIEVPHTEHPTKEEAVAAWNTRCFPDTTRKLADFLVAHGLIDLAAVEDPEGYDAVRTMALIAKAAEDLCVPDTIRVTQRMDREKFIAAKPKKELGW